MTCLSVELLTMPRKFAVLTKQLHHDRRRRCRCSAGTRGQFVARTWGVLFAGIEYALFFANCPLCYTATPLFTAELSGHRYVVFNRFWLCFGRWLCPLIVFHFVRPTCFACRFAFCFPDARGLTARFFSRIALCSYFTLLGGKVTAETAFSRSCQ